MLNRIITVVIVLAVVAVAAVVALGGFDQESSAAEDDGRRDDSASRDLVGPHSPEPGALPGTMVVARGQNCVVQVVDLGGMRLSKSGPDSGCDFIVAPDGETAAVVAEGQGSDVPRPQLELVELDGRPETVRSIGRLGRAFAWSSDATRLAGCDAAGSGDTVIIDVEGGARGNEAGCWPAFGIDDSLVTRTAVDLTQVLSTDGIHRDGVEEVTLGQILEAAGSEPDAQGFVLGHTSGTGGLVAVSAVQAPPNGDPVGSIQLWRGDVVDTVTEIPLFLEERGIPGDLVADALRDELVMSPNGREVAIALKDGDGPLFIIDIRTGSVLGPLDQSDFDWSPDGLWLAVADVDGVDIYGPSRDEEPTYQIPLVTPVIAWRE